MGDGGANKLIANTLFDAAPDAPLEGSFTPESAAPDESAVEQLFAPMLQIARRSARQLRGAINTTVDAATHPQETLRKAGFAMAGAGMLASELLRTADPPSPLKGAFGLRKRVAWSAPVSLADVKAIGAPMGAKINDVLVAGMTGALRTYLSRCGVDVNHTTVRAMVPVDLRPLERTNQLGNEFGVVLLDLAIGSRQRLQRVLATKANMDALKRSPEPVAALALFNLLGRVPRRSKTSRRRCSEQGQRGHDQRRRPATTYTPRRCADRARDVLGATPGQGNGHGHQHPELLRQRHAIGDCRRESSARPGGDHARVQSRVRDDAEGGAGEEVA